MSIFNITGNWLAGFTDAEGSFCIYITGVEQINVSFCFYLSQKDIEPLIKCAEFIDVRARKLSEFAEKKTMFKKQGGIMNIEIKQHAFLLKVIKPLFEEFPLRSSKYFDFLLFFEALSIYTNFKISRPERIIQVAHIMFGMNTKGSQRVNCLHYYEQLIESKFNNHSNLKVINKACADQKQRIVQHLTTQKIDESSLCDDYFVGL